MIKRCTRRKGCPQFIMSNVIVTFLSPSCLYQWRWSHLLFLVCVQAVLGHDDCVTALLEHKASALCRDVQGRTPLHYAASRGHTEILASMVQAAMATDHQDKLLDNKQYTPLHWAAYKGWLGLIDFKWLIPKCRNESLSHLLSTMLGVFLLRAWRLFGGFTWI